MSSAQTTASTLAILAGDDTRRLYMQQRMRYMATVLQVILLSTAYVSKHFQVPLLSVRVISKSTSALFLLVSLAIATKGCARFEGNSTNSPSS
jgi:hypothetical protein